MKRNSTNISVVTGQIAKSPTEIVQVIRKRLNGKEYVHLPVFSIGGSKNEKGICFTIDDWGIAIPMIQAAIEINFPDTDSPSQKEI